MQKLKIEKKLFFELDDEIITLYKTNLLDWDNDNIFICDKNINLFYFSTKYNITYQTLIAIPINEFIKYNKNEIPIEIKTELYQHAIENNFKIILFATNSTKQELEKLSNRKLKIKNILNR